MTRVHRRDRFFVRASIEHAFELAGDPHRFPEFNPVVRVPEHGRVERVGHVYHQVVDFGPIHVSTRWETTAVDPPKLADDPRPPPPWTTVEIGDLPLAGRWVSTSRYEAVPGGTLITHDLEYGVPDGPTGRALELLLRPFFAVGFALIGRRLRRWIESDAR